MLLRALTAIAALTVLTLPAIAESARKSHTVRQALNTTPVKECTRLNGRVGYYANPWCTPAEQLRWDKWETTRKR